NDTTTNTGWTNTTTTTIQNYTTTLTIQNGTNNPGTNVEIKFYANYSNAAFGSIGRLIWNTTILGGTDAYSAAFYDCDKDGIKECVAAGTSSGGDDVYLLNPDGSVQNQYNTGPVTQIISGDLNNDTYENEFAIASSAIRWYNHSGQIATYGVGSQAIVLCDLTGDGIPEIAGGGSNEIGAAYANGTQLWYRSITGYARELACADVTGDGINDVAYVEGDYLYVLYGQNGSTAYQSALIDAISVSAIDLDNDGKKDELVVGTTWNGGNEIHAFNNTNITEIWQTNKFSNSAIRDIAVGDFDGDGYEDDFAAVSPNEYLYVFSANMTGAYEIFNKSGTTAEHFNYIYAADINDDGTPEIIGGNSNNYTSVFTTSGAEILRYTTEDKIGDSNSYGKHSPLATGDIDGDGILELAVASYDGRVYVIQEVSCTASFNDSTSYNMTWNSTLRKWQVGKTFTSPGTYSYNVTCSKGGYETQTASSTITISPSPVVRTVNITPTTAYTNTTLT
ncbi:MAG: hypothetical protein D6706_16475, partial [Chloroflexi bacterium]